MDYKFFGQLLYLIYSRLEDLQKEIDKKHTSRSLMFLNDAIKLNFRVKGLIEKAFDERRVIYDRKKFKFLEEYIKTK